LENKRNKKNKKNKNKTKKAKQKKKTQQQPSLSFRAGVLVNKFIFNLIYWSSYSDFPSSIEKKKYEKRKKEDEQNESQLYTQKKISLSCLFRFLIYFLVYGSDEFHRANRTKFIFLNRSKNTFIKNIIKQNKGNPKKK